MGEQWEPVKGSCRDYGIFYGGDNHQVTLVENLG